MPFIVGQSGVLRIQHLPGLRFNSAAIAEAYHVKAVLRRQAKSDVHQGTQFSVSRLAPASGLARITARTASL